MSIHDTAWMLAELFRDATVKVNRQETSLKIVFPEKKAEPTPSAPQNPHPKEDVMLQNNPIPTSTPAQQEISGPISRDIKTHIISLGDLVAYLPPERIMQARRSIMGLNDCCERIKGLENAAYIGPEAAA
jgi:hypothetical protein